MPTINVKTNEVTLSHDMVVDEKFWYDEYLPRVRASRYFRHYDRKVTPNGDWEVKLTLGALDKSLYAWLVELLGEKEFISIERTGTKEKYVN